jgi:HD-like signal output (HDOD) protein/prolyl-tRNA editing enzyme YbaK/EbsC (Cys-tRNA(Pro) deacylase)
LPVPASVKQLLDKKNVSYSISETEEAVQNSGVSHLLHEQRLRIAGAARSMILQDGQGRLQVVIPANCLLDMDAVNQELGRTMRPTTDTELQSFFDKHQLASVPALPKLGGMPTLVDQRLLAQEVVLLDSGADELLEVNRDDFAVLVADALVGDVCVALTDLEHRRQQAGSDEDEILNAVKTFTSKRIRQRLEETLELPPLPETAQRIIKLRVDPNADISDLANIVETDPSLAAQVVSWASSPYYSAPGKIKSIHDAIVRVLGFDMVLNLALGLALGKTMSMPKDGPNGSTPYWQQAVYNAAAVEGLVTAIPRENRPGFGMAYLSGLLHNFGWLVLAEVFPPQFSNICRFMEANRHVPPHLVEFHILGVTREQMSSWLMQLWNMPVEVVVALRQQNSLDSEMEHGEYAKLLFVAQRLLQQKGIGQGPKMEIPDSMFRQLHLDPEKAEQTVETILSSSSDLDNIANQLNG